MVYVFMGKIHDVIAFNYMFSGDGLFCSHSQAEPERRHGLVRGIEAMMMSIEPPAAIHGIPLPTTDTSGDELFRMGLLYSTGQGGAPLDYVSAHMLFNLAAMRGSVEAKVYRKEISQEMASEDVAEAQRQAREWLAHG
jgi:TPR repeat protein